MIKNPIAIYKRITGSLEYRNILRNFGFLSLIQLGNYLLPLISMPYLMGVLGVESFGRVMFAQAFIQYFITLVEYGFNFSATREIALNREDKEKVSEIFCSVMAIKLIFFFVALVVLMIVLFTVPKFFVFRSLYFLTFASLLGSLLFPTWLFQGLEKMKYITFVNLASRVISTFSFILFIKDPGDFLHVPLINAVAAIVPSVMALFYLRRVFPIRLRLPARSSILLELKHGWFIFLSSVSTSLYGATNSFLLGLLFNDTYVGYYAFGEKIIRAGTMMLMPLNSALFPYMSLKMKESRPEGLKVFRTVFLGLLAVTGFGVVAIYLGSDLIVYLINSEFYPSVSVLKILSPLLAIVGISNLIGFQILYTDGQERKFLISVFIAGIINLVCLFLLSARFQYKAAAMSLLISEGFICLSFLYYSRKILFEKT